MVRSLLVPVMSLICFWPARGIYAAEENLTTCQLFLADINLTNNITKGQHNGTPCPCYEQRVSLDYSFHKNGNCYKQWFSVNNMKQMCCYDSNGNLQLGPQNGGYLIPNTLESKIEDKHDVCCTDTEMCKRFYEMFPSDNCSTSTSYIEAKSWGDPEITTLDEHSYSFNGRGEYTFLETENRSFQIQTRTDYVKGNTDSTMFVAFVLYDGIDNDSITVTRTGEALQLFQQDGTFLADSRNCTKAGKSLKMKFMFFCRPNGFGIQPVQRLNIKDIQVSVENFMKIEITGWNITGMRGLAGNLKNGFFVSNNGSRYNNATATEEQLYYYGESFRLKSVNESKFNYAITEGNFTYWNRDHKAPRFLNKLAKEGNYSELFRNYSKEDIKNFTSICTNSWDNIPNIQCLVLIAKTEDIKQGEHIMDESEKEHRKYVVLHNKPPEFLNSTPTFLNVSYGSTNVLDLKKFAKDDSDLPEDIQYEVMTNLTEMEIENGVFNWTVGKELRYNNFDLRFILNDTLGFTAGKEITIYYCGCEQISQCDFSSYNKNSSDKVKKAICKCPEYTSGLYCEIEEDPCDDFNCNTTCDKTLKRTLQSWPCVACPEGRYERLVSKNQICENINECEIKQSPCDQLCNDTDGSYVCSCNDGYELNVDKHKCDDKDECDLNPGLCSGVNEVCLNTPGNYKCICRPGYIRDGNQCAKSNGPRFVGFIAFAIISPLDLNDRNIEKANKDINTPDKREEMQKKLTTMFKNVTNVDKVEVIRIYYVKSQQKRAKREDVKTAYLLHIEYVLICKNATNGTVLNAAISANKKWDVTKIGHVTIDTKSIDIKVYNSSEGGICKIPHKTDCSTESTDCIDYDNGTYSCQCKSGFKRDTNGENYCKDIDECALFKKNMTTDYRCVHGDCTNGVGSWNCTCPPDRLWQSVGDAIKTVYRCQGNFSYIGTIKVADYNAISKRNIEDFFHNQFRKFFTNPENENKSYTVSMNDLYVSATILNLNETMRHASFRQYNIMYRLRLGEAIETERVFNVLKIALGSEEFRVKNGSLDIGFVHNSYYIFRDSDNNLCDLTFNGGCDLATTKCRQRNGSTFCDCKKGYERKLGKSEKFCSDKDECNDGIKRCNGEHCVNLPGNWTCECEGKGKYSVPVREDRNNFACINLTICEQKQKYFKCINGNRTCVDDHWKCSCDNGSSPVWKDNGEVICEGEYKYIMSTGIVVPASVDITNDRRETYEKYMKEQITSVYSSKFPTQHVTVEIISVGIVVGNRQKREATKRLEVEFVLHFETKVSRKNITDAWTEYVNKNCSDGCKVAKDLPPMFIDKEIYIAEDQSTALCSLLKYNHCDPVSTTCQLTDGRVDCSCNKGYTKTNKSDSTCEVSCKDNSPCESGGTCIITKSNSGYELKCLCTDGRKGKYCEEVDPDYNVPSTKQTEDQTNDTTLIAVSSSLGGFIFILLVVFLLIFRWRSGKATEGDKISLNHLDKDGFNNFNGSALRNQYLQDDVGSSYSHRLSSSSLPYGHQNGVRGSGRYSGNQKEPFTDGIFSIPNKLPRPNFHGSMPNLANGIPNFNPYDDRLYSGEDPRRMTSYEKGLNRSFDFDWRVPRNNWNGRRSPSPDYGIPKSPKVDYGRTKSPKPDYHQARKHYRSKDSGVGNGNSSGSYEYQRPEKTRDYYYGQRQSTNF